MATRFDGDEVYQEAINKHDDAETRALIVLHMASRHLNVEGLSAAQIAKVLKERFKQPVSRSAIKNTLTRKSTQDKLVLKEGGNYRIMQPGIDRVDAMFAGKV